MNKKYKLIAMVCAGLVLGSSFMPLSNVYAAKQFTNGMDIDVNYDPFKDANKGEQVNSQAKQEQLTFSQRMALKNQDKGATDIVVANSGVLPGNIYIPKHTKLNVELVDRVDCKKVKKYQSIGFKTIENLIINDVVVIPAGTIGKGYVYEVQKPGGFGRKGVLRIAAHEIKTMNGITVPLMKGLEGKGKTDGGAVAVAAAVSLLGGFLMRGAGISYEAGTDFVVEVRNDTDLQCKPESLAEAMNPTKPRGQVIYIK